MKDNIYIQLRNNPPKLEVVANAREVIITTISCMCDNKHTLTLKKNEDGDFKLSGNGFALSNWQMKHDRFDIEWAADESKWDEVFHMINTGTSNIQSLRSR